MNPSQLLLVSRQRATLETTVAKKRADTTRSHVVVIVAPPGLLAGCFDSQQSSNLAHRKTPACIFLPCLNLQKWQTYQVELMLAELVTVIHSWLIPDTDLNILLLYQYHMTRIRQWTVLFFFC